MNRLRYRFFCKRGLTIAEVFSFCLAGVVFARHKFCETNQNENHLTRAEVRMKNWYESKHSIKTIVLIQYLTGNNNGR